MNIATVGKMYKLKDSRQRCYSGPREYQNEKAELTATLDDIDGGLFFSEGLAGIRYWNVQDVEEA